MTNTIILHLLRLIGLLLLQVLVLNHIELHGFLSLYIYHFFILFLPFETPIWVLLLSAFGSGLCVDVFDNTLGIHAAALVLTAYLRQYAITLLTPVIGYQSIDKPQLGIMGMNWFLKYTILLTFIHHFGVTFLELFSLQFLPYTLLKSALDTVVSVVLVLIYQYLFIPRE